MDNVVDKVVALGVPGLVLILTMHIVGFAGAAAITAALATLGGPIGMLGGIGVLILLGLAAKFISDNGFELFYRRVVDGLKARGETKESVLRQIDGFPISRGLKAKLKAYIHDHWDD